MNDEYRSTTFDKFKILKQIPGILLFSLQKEKAASQLDDPEVIDLSKDINDFEDTASIIKELDLIISVDTSVAHLAGAMGKPVWTLLAFNSDWRWLLERKDSPWYPSMKLFRQKKLGDWDSVFKEICEEVNAKSDLKIKAAIAHRIGDLQVGDLSIIIVVGSKHRDAAYTASRYIIEQIKVRTPIWKKEFYEDGETEWLKGHALCDDHPTERP